ncbi:protein of unknown function DUF924 [Leptothrix cholodnii SP-6]|uniref:Transmembrane protein n=1 Tax=Leptothrix cholodnii (strain ATCC 51168 / LMG 8142 / SP-6) TaxID=395495 RepID=B1Y2Q3_LEPCP|nr:DUF924 family protein [Leptothrix cholodnii]ACB34395.1 protein of unknown function DUF924 [Leptothrix cholodnii SP-6]
MSADSLASPGRPAEAQAVLDFWFGPPGDPGHLQPRRQWFEKDAAFDALIGTRFGPLIESGLAGELMSWADETGSALAEIIVLDQFPRNLFRGTPRAFAGDSLALEAATRLVKRGADRRLSGVQRQFVYLPFEHAESMVAQHCSMALFEQLGRDEPGLAGLLDWARRHHDIVARFGRFPHRNPILGRVSTADEIEFLKQPGSGF